MKDRITKDPAATPAHGPVRLVGQWLSRLKPRSKDQDLPPPGQRSGHGSDSLEPYLHHGRTTRPSPLE